MNATTRLDAKVAADRLGRVRPRLDVIAPGSSVHVPRSHSALPPKATETARVGSRMQSTGACTYTQPCPATHRPRRCLSCQAASLTLLALPSCPETRRACSVEASARALQAQAFPAIRNSSATGLVFATAGLEYELPGRVL